MLYRAYIKQTRKRPLSLQLMSRSLFGKWEPFKKTGAWFCGLTQSYVDEVFFAGFEGQFMEDKGGSYMVDAGQLILRANERGNMRTLVSYLRERPQMICVPLGKWKLNRSKSGYHC